ncbi:MAG: nucleoside monophosphate kinase [Bdellovibrionales bacterium]|jgi:adenylate kinase|nr:nucleoside monophosphate kinase [Bdellovibrionales bacterium]
MKPQLILLGAPGSGKGTQANKLISEFGYNHISTGDLLRDEVKKTSELGKEVETIINSGNLVSDEIVLKLLKANCNINNNIYIFDGFPRNLVQAKSLTEEILHGSNYIVIYFEMSTELLVERISNRRIAINSGKIYNLLSKPPKIHGKCDVSGEDLIHRKDDNEETVRNRIKIFKNTIDPMISYYRENNSLEVLDASNGPDEIFKDLIKLIGNS